MRKLAWASISFSAAVFVSRYFLNKTALLSASIILLLIGIFGFLFTKNDVRRRLVLFGVFAALGIFVFYGAYRTNDLPCRELDNKEVTITGELIDYPKIYDTFSKVKIRLEKGAMPGEKCYLSSYQFDLSDLVPGDKIKAEVKFKDQSIRFDREKMNYGTDGVFLGAYILEEPEIEKANYRGARFLPQRFSHKIKLIADEIFPFDTAGFMRALLTGDKSQIYDKEQYSDLGDAGILHIVAVSGMHVSFLVGFIMFLAGKRRWAALVGIILVWFFVPMAGSTHSVVRAAFMQTLVLIAPLVKREYDGITSISFALACILLINPYACTSVGLQLSFSSMLGILVFTPYIYKCLTKARKEKRRLQKTKDKTNFMKLRDKIFYAVMSTIAASLGAMILTTPLLFFHFGYMPLYSLITNILVFSAVSIAFVAGYIVSLIGLIYLPLAKILAYIPAIFAKYILIISHFISGLPVSTIYLGKNIFGLWIVITYMIFAFVYLRSEKKHKTIRFIMPVSLSICLFCGLFILNLGKAKFSDAEITAIDIGQGQCLLITEGTESIMIDCGGRWIDDNAGDRAAAFMMSNGRFHVDVLALTHYDEDHINGIERLMSKVEVKNIILPLAPEDKVYRKLEIEKLAKDNHVNIIDGDKDFTINVGNMQLTVYGPISKIEPCLMYLAKSGDYEAFISGDAYEEEELRFLESHDLPDTEIYISGHHGSRYAGSEKLLESVKAENAIISCGYNSYGHPAPETIDKLKKMGMKYYITKEKGSISLPMHD